MEKHICTALDNIIYCCVAYLMKTQHTCGREVSLLSVDIFTCLWPAIGHTLLINVS